MLNVPEGLLGKLVEILFGTSKFDTGCHIKLFFQVQLFKDFCHKMQDTEIAPKI
jgi:hypothetical protein